MEAYHGKKAGGEVQTVWLLELGGGEDDPECRGRVGRQAVGSDDASKRVSLARRGRLRMVYMIATRRETFSRDLTYRLRMTVAGTKIALSKMVIRDAPLTRQRSTTSRDIQNASAYRMMPGVMVG